MRIRSFALAVTVLLVSAVSAHAKSAVQITPDNNTIVVNKAIGNPPTEQWVLSLNLFDQTLIGNVFDVTGKNPTFFSCNVDTTDGSILGDPSDLVDQTLTFVCSIASGCSALPCDPASEWHDLGSVSPLPGTFFLP